MFAHVCVIQNMFVLWSQAACLWNYTEFLIRRLCVCVIGNVCSRNVAWCLCVCVIWNVCSYSFICHLDGGRLLPRWFHYLSHLPLPRAHFNILPSHVCTLPNISANWKWGCWQQVKQRCKITQHITWSKSVQQTFTPRNASNLQQI